jgi:GxxExxY protein
LPQKSAEGAKNCGMKDPVFQLAGRIRATSRALPRHLRRDHVEKACENGLSPRLRKPDLAAAQRHPLGVFDEDGTPLGDFHADRFVSQQIIVELEARRSHAGEHIAQLLGYLRASRIEHGLPINLGSPRLEIRKLALSQL